MKVLEQKTKQKCDFTEDWELLTRREQRKVKRLFMDQTGLSQVSFYGLLFGRDWMSVERTSLIGAIIDQIKTGN